MDKNKFFNLSMFTLRVVVGFIFAVHGAQKLFGMFGGIGLEGTVKMVEGISFLNPYLVAVAWASIELVGGIFLIFGILARWSALFIMLTVLIHLWKFDLTYDSLMQSMNIEYNALILSSCLSIVLMGGGSWSVWDT